MLHVMVVLKAEFTSKYNAYCGPDRSALDYLPGGPFGYQANDACIVSGSEGLVYFEGSQGAFFLDAEGNDHCSFYRGVYADGFFACFEIIEIGQVPNDGMRLLPQIIHFF